MLVMVNNGYMGLIRQAEKNYDMNYEVSISYEGPERAPRHRPRRGHEGDGRRRRKGHRAGRDRRRVRLGGGPGEQERQVPVLVEIMVAPEDDAAMGKSIDHVREFEPVERSGARPVRRPAGARGLTRRSSGMRNRLPSRGSSSAMATRAATAFSRSTARSTCWRRWRAARRARGLGGRGPHRAGGEHRAPAAGQPGRPRLRRPEPGERPLRARLQGARAGGRARGADRRALRPPPARTSSASSGRRARPRTS